MNILVLCTGNSARSILGEVLINALGAGRYTAYSAGSNPVGIVNPDAVAVLQRAGLDTAGLESKSWNRFSDATAPVVDIVITVCDGAAGEACPVFHGTPVTVHWGLSDPAAAGDTDAAFAAAFQQIKRRVEQMLELPLAEFEPRMRRESLQRIHESALHAELESGQQSPR